MRNWEWVGIGSQELICSDNCKLENEISKRQKKDSATLSLPKSLASRGGTCTSSGKGAAVPLGLIKIPNRSRFSQ